MRMRVIMRVHVLVTMVVMVLVAATTHRGGEKSRTDERDEGPGHNAEVPRHALPRE